MVELKISSWNRKIISFYRTLIRDMRFHRSVFAIWVSETRVKTVLVNTAEKWSPSFGLLYICIKYEYLKNGLTWSVNGFNCLKNSQNSIPRRKWFINLSRYIRNLCLKFYLAYFCGFCFYCIKMHIWVY